MQESIVLLKHIMLDKRLNYIPSRWILINAHGLQSLSTWSTAAFQTTPAETVCETTNWPPPANKWEILFFVFAMQIGLKRRPAGKSTETKSRVWFKVYLQANAGALMGGRLVWILIRASQAVGLLSMSCWKFLLWLMQVSQWCIYVLNMGNSQITV